MQHRIGLIFIVILLIGCTEESKNLPNESTYISDSALLVKTSDKFANESDVQKLRQVAIAMESTRTLNCENYNNECTLFAEFLSMAIRLTAKGTLSADERKSLQDKATEIRSAVEEGKRKLHSEWSKRKER
jgi:hypothetical protein